MHLSGLYLLRKGLVLKNKCKYHDAGKYLTKAHDYFTQEGNFDLISKSALYLGHLKQAEKKFSDADKHYQTALRIGKFTHNENEAKALYYLGEVSFQTKQKDKANSYFSEALEKDIKDKRISGYGWNYYGLACCTNNESEKAKLASQASECFSKLNMNDQALLSEKLTSNQPGTFIF